MTSADGPYIGVPKRLIPKGASLKFAAVAGDLLPVCDFFSVLLAGYLSLVAYARLVSSSIAQADNLIQLHRMIWIAAAIAPFMLYERRFADRAGAGEYLALLRGFVGRILKCLVVTSAIALAGRWLNQGPSDWVVLWLASVVVITLTSRALLLIYLRGRMPEGLPAEAAPAVATAQLSGNFGTEVLDRDAGPILGDILQPGSANRNVVAGNFGSQVHIVGYVGDWLAVALLADRPIKRWDAVLKTAEDAVLSTILTVLLLPLLALIALAIRLDSPGPILFKQRRHGFNNRTFDIYKFRTMRYTPAATDTSLQQTARGDERITRVGRYLRKLSLDELPQIFNVLEGNMSLVGPRPHALHMRTEERLGHEITDVYAHRHRVKPGITGWSQINGLRGATQTVEQLRKRIELDIHYIENWSLLLDLKILLLTFNAVLKATNAY